MYLGSFGIFLNRDFMNSLSAKDRRAIMNVSGEQLSEMAGSFWQIDVQVGEVDAEKSGNTIQDASASVLKEFAAMTQGMDANWIAEVKDRKINASAALKALRRKVKEN